MAGELPKVRVDALRSIRQLLLRWPEIAEACGLLPEIHAVFDTNVIIEDVRFLTSKRRDPNARTDLQELLASGIIVGYFPAECLDQVEAKLDELSERYKIPRHALASAWQGYRSALRILPTTTIPLTAEEVSLRDPTDLPFVRLEKLVNTQVIFSSDKDLVAAGCRVIAPVLIRFELREFARAKTLHLSVVVGGTVTVSIALVGIVQFIAAIARLLAAAPRWVHVALIAVSLAVLANPAWRSTVLKKLDAIGHAASGIWGQIQPALAALAVHAADADRRSQELWRTISAAIPGAVERPVTAGIYPLVPLPGVSGAFSGPEHLRWGGLLTGERRGRSPVRRSRTVTWRSSGNKRRQMTGRLS